MITEQTEQRKKDTRNFEELVTDIAYEILSNAFIGDVNETCHTLEDFEHCSSYWDLCLEQSKKIVRDELKNFIVIKGEKIN